MGVAAPMLVPGAIAAMSPAMTTNTPAEAARAPLGATQVRIGTCEDSTRFTMSRMLDSRPPGVSASNTSARTPLGPPAHPRERRAAFRTREASRRAGQVHHAVEHRFFAHLERRAPGLADRGQDQLVRERRRHPEPARQRGRSRPPLDPPAPGPDRAHHRRTAQRLYRNQPG